MPTPGRVRKLPMIIGTLNQQGSKRKTTLFVVGRHLIENEFFGGVDIKKEDPEPPFHDHILRVLNPILKE
jgi:hypothetical protein